MYTQEQFEKIKMGIRAEAIIKSPRPDLDDSVEAGILMSQLKWALTHPEKDWEFAFDQYLK